ncbi:MAG TPA: hypothetical protein VF527_21375 [Pyrinomonadaceae bacterium]|jgi:hypothetical protein
MPKLKFSYRIKNITARRTGSGVAVVCCALLVLAAFGMSYGQAGRRVAKPKTDPPVPKPAETAVSVNAPTPEPEKIPLLVAGSPSMSMTFMMGVTDKLPGVVGRRLQDSKRLQATNGGEMSRGEANKRAKNVETKTFIVWIELQGSGFNPDPVNGRTRIEDLSIHYVVLEPGTGKMKDKGNVPLRPVRGGILGGTRRLPSCYPQAHSNFEYALVVAGIKTAERIFHSLSLPNPPLCS